MSDTMYDLVMSPRAEAEFQAVGEFVRHRGARSPNEDGMIAALRGADAALTSWGVRFSDRVIEETRLKVIGHAAGSVKWLPPLVWERGIAVTHAAPVIAVAVGEMALALTLACLRRIPEHDAAFKERGTRGEDSIEPKLLATRSLHESRVGIIGASSTGREFLKLLRAFGDVDVWITDPYLDAAEAVRLGVRKAELAELFAACDVVSLHCPSLPETRHMVNAPLLAQLKDGAVLINTARGALVDHDALLAELRTGRISAGLDVYLETLSDEHLPLSAYRQCPNVVITPGIAGPAGTITKRMGLFIAQEFERFFAGQPLQKPVTADLLSYIA
ncbi:MAG: hydroxyacid dehydrogenase [Chloroflexota bacterium]